MVGVCGRAGRLLGAAALFLAASLGCRAQPINLPSTGDGRRVFPIDLPTVLRLAHARSLDIQITRARLAEARAAHQAALYRFFPWIAPGVTYGRHEGRLQDSSGVIRDVNKQFYAPGATLVAQVQWGEAIYAALAAHQLVQAARQGVATQEQDTVLAAAQRYFDLTKANAQAGVAREAVRISEDYQEQLHRAVDLGIAFKGDEYRVRLQTERYQLTLRADLERSQVAAARLAELLHLDATVRLSVGEAEPVPLSLAPTNAALDTLVAQALVSRPELRQGEAFVAAAKHARSGAVYGPLIPSLGAQGFAGGLGGGIDDETGQFGSSGDGQAFLGWRLGPGGLFDASRRHATEARLDAARLIYERFKDQVIREVIESRARVASLADQIATGQQALTNAAEALRLTQERKEFAVGDVLENILSQQELTRARNDYVDLVAEYDKAEFALRRATGEMLSPAPPAAAPGPARP